MRTRILILAPSVLLAAVLPVSAQKNSAPHGNGNNQTTSESSPYLHANYCATNSGARDPHCVEADTGSSTYRDNDAAGWSGVLKWEQQQNGAP